MSDTRLRRSRSPDARLAMAYNRCKVSERAALVGENMRGLIAFAHMSGGEGARGACEIIVLAWDSLAHERGTVTPRTCQRVSRHLSDLSDCVRDHLGEIGGYDNAYALRVMVDSDMLARDLMAIYAHLGGGTREVR